MNLSSTMKMNNGVEIPLLGLGVFQSQEGDEAYNAVRYALDAGYRHIDTAMVYQNEVSVGKAIRESGIPRKDVFLTTKLWNQDMRDDNQYKAFEDSLDRLGMDYVDLYLIHWPVKGKYVESWKVLEKIYAEKRSRAVGVSNFHIYHLEDIFAASDLVPAVNQVECHPWHTQVELAAYNQKKGIIFEPWSPLGQAKKLDDAVIVGIAKKHGKTPAQVVLRWGLQRGFINIPKSVKKERIIENSLLFDFELDKGDMDAIFGLNKNERVMEKADPDNVTF